MSSNALTDLLNDTWLIKKKVGRGSFSALYLAKNVISNVDEYVAIKIPIAEVESSVIKWEGDVIRGSADAATCPSSFIMASKKDKIFWSWSS